MHSWIGIEAVSSEAQSLTASCVPRRRRSSCPLPAIRGGTGRSEDENGVELGVAVDGTWATICLRATAGSPAATGYANERRRNETRFGWLFVDGPKPRGPRPYSGCDRIVGSCCW